MATDFPVCTKTNPSAGDHRHREAGSSSPRGRTTKKAATTRALRRFKDAYNLDCSKPELLLIVSATYERKGDRVSAVAALETYVQRAPKDAPDMATTQAKIENLKKQIAATSRRRPRPFERTDAADERQRAGSIRFYPWDRGRAWALRGDHCSRHRALYADRAGLARRTATRSTGYDARRYIRPLARPDADLTPRRSRQPKAGQPEQGLSDGYAINTVGIVFTIMAGGGVDGSVGGLVWHFLEPTGPNDKSSSAHLTPAVGPGFRGLSFDTTF